MPKAKNWDNYNNIIKIILKNEKKENKRTNGIHICVKEQPVSAESPSESLLLSMKRQLLSPRF